MLRALSSSASGIGLVLYSLVAILFVTAVVSAALSTIDSILIAVSGIASDNLENRQQPSKRKQLRLLAWVLILAGFLFSADPPTFIVDLASLQLSGLTALLPCLLGPLFGYDKPHAGWGAFVFGLTPVLAERILGVGFWGIDPGVVGLASGTAALVLISWAQRTTSRLRP